MPSLRHIALMVEDPEKTALFFTEVFGMKRVGELRCGCQMSDGVVSVSLMMKEYDHEQIGIDHFGLLVDDLGEAMGQAQAAGAELIRLRPEGDGAADEAKFLSPDGIAFDLSTAGWPGASK